MTKRGVLFVWMLYYLSTLVDLLISSCEVKFKNPTQVYTFSQCSVVPFHKLTVLEKLQGSIENVKRKASGAEMSDPNFFLTHQE